MGVPQSVATRCTGAPVRRALTAMTMLRRTFISLLLALIVVSGLSVLAIGTFLQRPVFAPLEAFPVQRATAGQVEQARRQLDGQSDVPASVPVVAGRQRRGFVQLEFEVSADGRPNNIRVVGAAPAGYYEEQALRRIASQRFEPARQQGGAPAPARSEIIEFEYSSSPD